LVRSQWVRGPALLSALLAAGAARGSEPRLHDGAYFRLSLGASAVHVARSTDTDGVRPSLGYPVDESTVRGTALTAEIAAGYTPFRGVALTGLLLAHVLSPAELTLVDDSPVRLSGPYGVVLVAPGVDVFANPGSGLHLSTALGLLVAHGGIEDDVIDSIGGVGVAGTMALGYDAWVASEWSVGASVRGLLGGMAGESSGPGTTATERSRVSSFGVAVTVLHH